MNNFFSYTLIVIVLGVFFSFYYFGVLQNSLSIITVLIYGIPAIFLFSILALVSNRKKVFEKSSVSNTGTPNWSMQFANGFRLVAIAIAVVFVSLYVYICYTFSINPLAPILFFIQPLLQ